jgi:hypothetical protein
MIKKPTKKINWKKQADDAFSLLIRTEAGFICQFHERLREKGIVPPCVCNGVMQNCHKISRGANSIRYDRRNVLCGCSGSNTWAHFHDGEWQVLWKLMYPQDVEYLETRKHLIVHRKAWDYAIIIAECGQKLEGLK